MPENIKPVTVTMPPKKKGALDKKKEEIKPKPLPAKELDKLREC